MSHSVYKLCWPQCLHFNTLLLFSILTIFGPVRGQSKPNPVTSLSCAGRCALFVHPSEKPACQCDGMCYHNHDCCTDYKKVCLQKIVPKKSTELQRYVGGIVGGVFAVIIVLAVIYFVAINRKGEETYLISSP